MAEFKNGDRVRVTDPNSEFYNWTGEVDGPIKGEEISNRPHGYYRVNVVVTLNVTLPLCFREDKLERQAA